MCVMVPAFITIKSLHILSYGFYACLFCMRQRHKSCFGHFRSLFYRNCHLLAYRSVKPYEFNPSIKIFFNFIRGQRLQLVNYMAAKVFHFLLALLQGNCAFLTCSKSNKPQKTNLHIPVKVNVTHVFMPHFHI